MKGIGALEMGYEAEGKRNVYNRIVGYLVDLEANGMTLREAIAIRGSADRPEDVVRELRGYVESGDYRKVCNKLLSFDGLFTFQMKKKGKIDRLEGEMIVRSIK